MDLLIRTSGEHRLSDFLLWQSRYAQLVFSNTLWPDYSFWDLLQALVQYQRSYPELQKIQQTATESIDTNTDNTSCSSQGESETDVMSVLGHASDTSKPINNKQSAGSTADVTDVDTSDSSTSSESRPSSPVTSSSQPFRSTTLLRLAPASILSQHQRLGVSRQEKDCHVLADDHELHTPLDGSSLSEHHDCQHDMTSDTLHISSQDGPQQPAQDNITKGAAQPMLLSEYSGKPPPKTLRAEVDCRQFLPDSLNRRKPHKVLSDTTK